MIADSIIKHSISQTVEMNYKQEAFFSLDILDKRSELYTRIPIQSSRLFTVLLDANLKTYLENRPIVPG